MDGAHGDEHARAVIEQNVANFTAGGMSPIVVEFDVFEGGDQLMADLGKLSAVRAEIRALPSGQREVVDVVLRRAGGGVSLARALRVLHAGDDIANTRAELHRRPRSMS